MVFTAISMIQVAAAVGSALIAGVFFAFSSFVMPALARLPAVMGLRAMQSINVVVLNRSFLGAFMGTAGLCLVVALRALSRLGSPGWGLELSGSALYLLGCVVVTRVGNIPYNDALARVVPEDEGAAAFWERFVKGWTAWNHVRTAASLVAAVLLVLSLGGCSRLGICASPDGAKQAALPTRLSETGWTAHDVREFRPRFELWSDGAVKRRFIALPPGERIDTSDVNDWRFPVGTRLWKEFSVNGVRVETRLLQKTGPGDEDWAAQAYVWQPNGEDALAAPAGQDDALGTEHDVPSAARCWACHGGRKSFVLGFSAVQLAYEAEGGLVDLEELVAEQRVSEAPRASFEVPGDETAREALGYLHANCSHCHNQRRPEAAAGRCFDPRNGLDFALRSGELGTVEETAAYRSARGAAFEPGAPDDSRMIELVASRSFLQQMPPLGTERVDARAMSTLRRWVTGLR